jgi:predicted permease
MPEPGRREGELRSRLWRTPVDDEVDAELEFHIEMRAREYMERGLDPEKAREAALARLGDRRAVAATCRRIGRQRDRRRRSMEYLAELRHDIAYAARRLRRSPLTTGVSVLTMGLGIGATTAIFSVVKAVVLSPFPYAHPDRVVLVSETLRGGRGDVSAGNFADWRERAASFEELAAFHFASFNLADSGSPERVRGAFVTSGFFSVYGASPAAGRAFTPDEEEPGRGDVVILSHDLWTRRYGGASSVLGSQIHLSGVLHTVVGIMPPGFDPVLAGEELWVPYTLSSQRRADYDEHYLLVVALLRPDVSLAEADAEMREIARAQAERVPDFNAERDAQVESLQGLLIGRYDTQTLILLGAVFFILLIACANVANLLLAGGAARAKEIAVRAALGAGRGRVLRQLLTESLVLSLIAGAASVWLAHTAIRTVVSAAPPSIPRIGESRLDLGVLVFALVISLVASVAAGLVPALRAARRDIEGTLRDGRLMSAGAARDRTRTGLIVAEVALAFTLVVGASLMMRSLAHLSGLTLGFDPSRVITARVTLPEAGYEEPEAVFGAFTRMTALLAARPGVESAAAVSQAPLGPGGNENGLLPEGRSDEPGNRIFARLRLVTPGYLETLRIPLRRGRTFTEADAAGADRVMVVSEELARRAWPGADPIGKRVICCEGSPGDPRWKTVIGVVGDVLSRGPTSGLQPEFYLPAAQAPAAAWRWSDRTMTLAARASGSPEALAGTLRSVVAEVDPTVPAFRIRTMEEEMRRELAGNRFQMLLLTILAGIGLTLAMGGVYSVVSYFVSLRTSEIGLRIALGASGADVLRLLTREAMIPVLLGLAAGLGLALAATRLIQSSLFGVSPVDPISYALVALLFALVALVAILVPARRAVRIDPTRALQAE